MKIEREKIPGEGFIVPCVTLKPSNSRGAALVVHGYGGFKEETLGLAWRIAEGGFTTGAIDMRGHGQHPLELDENILIDVETAVAHFKQFGEVTAVGHSLGGRLSLVSSADYAIGISPALAREYTTDTKDLINDLRDYRVRNSSATNVFEILENLPQLSFPPDKSLIIYGSRDLPEIKNECELLKSEKFPVTNIEEALHGDIFLFEPTFNLIAGKMNEWYK